MISLTAPAGDPRPVEHQEGRANRGERAFHRITALGEMTGGIAHDFRNILAVIDSGLSLAERRADDPAALRACLLAAREGVFRGLKLTSRLLAFARKKEVATHCDDLNELLGNLKTFIGYGAGSDIRVEFGLTPGLPRCLVDPAQFNAAILNLVVNARDAMPGGGVIRIETTLAGAQVVPGARSARRFVRVAVSDSGHGMAPDVAERIFDPYFTTKGESGTGLGLPQVCACMTEVGGLLRVTSEVGLGTSFDLLFPVLEDAAAGAAEAAADLCRV